MMLSAGDQSAVPPRFINQDCCNGNLHWIVPSTKVPSMRNIGVQPYTINETSCPIESDGD